jgi:hypothetical protein
MGVPDGNTRIPWLLLTFSLAFVLLTFKKAPEPLLILAAGVAGLLIFKG